MAGRTGRVVRVHAYPSGPVRPGDLEVAEAPVPAVRDGEVLVRNECFAIDPALRLRLQARPPAGYLAPIPVGGTPPGFALGVVEQSRAPGFAAGDVVTHAGGWREYAVVPADGIPPLPLGSLTRVHPAPGVAPRHYLGVLGITGLTAYAGLFDTAALARGDVVWVSAAAGAVGSVVVQLAKRDGHRVVASAGTPDKVGFLLAELGADAAFSHRDGPVVDSVRACAPDGVDVYFDNVGGDHLAAALATLRVHGRIAACGAIATYDSAPVPGPSAADLFAIVAHRLTVRGLRVGDHLDRLGDLRRELEPSVASGDLVVAETVVRGLDAAPAALASLLDGRTVGRVVVELP